MKIVIYSTFALMSCPIAFAQQSNYPPGPCAQIEQACLQAGFVVGAAGSGNGVGVDCVNPIMQGVTNVPGATRPLPSVNSQLVSACAARNPNYGRGNLGSPCLEVKTACLNAGFVAGDWKNGNGLALDCVNPIMQRVANVPGATKPLPSVNPQIVSACAAQNPNYGQGKVGSRPAGTY